MYIFSFCNFIARTAVAIIIAAALFLLLSPPLSRSGSFLSSSYPFMSAFCLFFILPTSILFSFVFYFFGSTSPASCNGQLAVTSLTRNKRMG
ncbi:unnamed protein product [Meloidogyne enterolobii]|uniref:Uncharacterized protein n=1 Tax=Meloidogyne enterolobii TaxID=390850 RepID=A0ACB0XTK3_MELEN